MKLYFVAADNADGESLDMFVAAETPEEAIKLWAGEWEITSIEDDLFADLRIQEVPSPSTLEKGCVEWNLDDVELPG